MARRRAMHSVSPWMVSEWPWWSVRWCYSWQQPPSWWHGHCPVMPRRPELPTRNRLSIEVNKKI